MQEHLIELRQSVTRLKSHLVASSTFQPRHGKIKRTGKRPGHHSTWLRRATLEIAHTLFKVDE